MNKFIITVSLVKWLHLVFGIRQAALFCRYNGIPIQTALYWLGGPEAYAYLRFIDREMK
jgi:hypothetical protein